MGSLGLPRASGSFGLGRADDPARGGAGSKTGLGIPRAGMLRRILGPAPLRRLAMARALWKGTPARGDCPVGLGSGALTPLRPGNPTLDMADSLLGVGLAGRRAPGCGPLRWGVIIVSDYRNFVQSEALLARPRMGLT